MTTVQAEFDRLCRVFDRIGYPIKTAPPATEAQISTLINAIGFDVDEPLKDLWRISNGSRRYSWFADGEDGDFIDHEFLSIKSTLATWQLFAPYDEDLYSRWYDDESWGERDARIQRHFLRHSKWLCFAEGLGGSEMLQYDADPTENGKRGQIVLFSHDPDGIFWRAEGFLTFFKESNDLLEDLADEPEFLVEKLDLANPAYSRQPGLKQPETCHIVEFDFDGFRVSWPESENRHAADVRCSRNPENPLENSYTVLDLPFALRIDEGNLIFVDDGLEFEFGRVRPGDDIRVTGYKEVYVNDVRREHAPE